MPLRPFAALAATAVAISACTVTPEQRDTAGTGVASGAIGAIAAQALGADTGWTVAAATAAGTAGALYARNRAEEKCAYHTGDGDTVVVRECP